MSIPEALPTPHGHLPNAAATPDSAGRRRDDERFAVLRPAPHTWAVAAIHGEADRLADLHAALAERLRPDDNLIYLGNLLGRGPAVGRTIEELLLFRRAMLARRGADPRAIIYLRGGQEEMWQKLLQLQFATDPREVLTWMLGQGVGATLEAYGGSREAGLSAARQGALALSQWTSGLRDRLRAHDGHNALFGALRRAAFDEDRRILFVNAGLDPSRPLDEQRDSFWWGAGDFERLEEPFGSFSRLIRGFDPRHRGLRLGNVTVTLDGGCGFGGGLIAACLDGRGEIVDSIEA